VREVAGSLRSGALALGDYLDRLEAHFEATEPVIGAFYPEPERFARLRREAADLVALYPTPALRPALFGVPVGIKDIFHVDGFETTAGSAVPPAELKGSQGAAVTALAGAGALILGKTVTTEFAYFAPGATRNPVDPERTPGGSSSGSAAAVAADLCPLSLGTQTIGSICRPASFCGIVGFKPTYGRSSRDGVIPLAPSVDHVGCFTTDVAGAEQAAAWFCHDWNPAPPTRKPRCAVPESPYLGRAGRPARERLRRACEHLVGLGFDVRGVPVMEDFDAVEARQRRLVAAEAAAVHERWYAAHGDTYHPKTKELIESGLDISAEELATARAGRELLRDELTAAMDTHGIDLWLSPAAPGEAPRGLQSTGDPVMNLPWSYAGLPSVSLPLPCEGAELPLGLQVVGGWGADEELLAWARSLEEVFSP
jgi:Asp-tRNA(Asn)/Glu-tRNA(Gln) amidotransferase A subunit family amidase